MNRRTFITAAAAVSMAQTLPNALYATTETVAAPVKRPSPHRWQPTSVTSTWLGQSTILLNMFGVHILTDPVLFNAVGVRLFGATYGHTRLTKPPLAVQEIPKPDIVLLSHAHMDHTDRQSLEYLSTTYPEQISVLCAKNTRDVIHDLPWASLRELDWWESMTVHGITISAVEVLHNGARFPWDPDRRDGTRNGRSYNGYCMQSGGCTLFFAGDTAMTESVRELQSLRIDAAFMPIGAYHGYSRFHCTPEEALAMSAMIGARMTAPVHCMTFNQSDEPFSEPMQRYQSAVRDHTTRSGWKCIGEDWVIQ